MCVRKRLPKLFGKEIVEMGLRLTLWYDRGTHERRKSDEGRPSGGAPSQLSGGCRDVLPEKFSNLGLGHSKGVASKVRNLTVENPPGHGPPWPTTCAYHESDSRVESQATDELIAMDRVHDEMVVVNEKPAG